MTPKQYQNARKKLGLTQVEMSVELGISHRQIRRREKGETLISVEMALALDTLTRRFKG